MTPSNGSALDDPKLGGNEMGKNRDNNLVKYGLDTKIYNIPKGRDYCLYKQLYSNVLVSLLPL